MGRDSSGIFFISIYRKGSLNQHVGILSSCPAYTFREGGTTAIMETPMLGPEQWLEIGAMEIYDETLEYIEIGVLEVKLLSSKQKKSIIQDAKLDDEYVHICKVSWKGDSINSNYDNKEDILTWKGRIYVLKRMRSKVMKSEHDSKIAGHFGRDRTMELISRNFFWTKMEDDVRQYCNECDNCQQTKAPRHAKPGLLHQLELPSKPWTHISTDFITDLPESSGNTKILLVVDWFTKMAHFIPISKMDSPSVARAYLENVWKYHGFPEDEVSDQDVTFTGHYFTDLYNYIGNERSMSTAVHPQTDEQTERIKQVIEAYLRSYFHYEQNDWAEMLAMAEFAYNNSKHFTTKTTPISANYGYEPRTNWPTKTEFRNPASEMYGHFMVGVHTRLSEQLENVKESIAKSYNKRGGLLKRLRKENGLCLTGRILERSDNVDSWMIKCMDHSGSRQSVIMNGTANPNYRLP